MACCEKCWADAYWRWHCNPDKTQAEHYTDLLREREAEPCTEYEQRHGARVNEFRENPVGSEAASADIPQSQGSATIQKGLWE